MLIAARAKLYQRAVCSLLVALGLAWPAPGAPAAPVYDFSSWHLPLPAGEWAISRGPCGASAPYDHPCGYYEDDCAIDLVAPRGEIADTPVLAPQAGEVAFVGRRADAGITVMIEHADGRVSALMHLGRAVVAPGQRLRQGEVLGYAGSTGTTRAHLHFHVQPNLVERACLPLDGLDRIDYPLSRATSFNLTWSRLVLVDPPAGALGQMPPLVVSRARDTLPLPAVLAPGQGLQVPILIAGPPSAPATLFSPALGGGGVLVANTVISRTAEGSLFRIPVQAESRGGPAAWPVYADRLGRQEVFQLTYRVGSPIAVGPAEGVILMNPQFMSPASYSQHRRPPRLCWRLSAAAGEAPLHVRVRIAGPTPADSGWIGDTCWQPPSLPPGTYYWKVFVRDGRGWMNRTNQRPYAFVLH